ncbi:dienelactone hydrolase family protein [bacterium]|nr:dienelactone hydrolase family protein [bacterium]
MKKIDTSTLSFSVREPKDGKASSTVFFFALSAHDTLSLPPFCHPADILVENGARVISTTLPDHEENTRPYGIQEIWEKKIPALGQFIEDLCTGIKELMERFEGPFGAMGISRGAFIAMHAASKIEQIEKVCCFAPMLQVGKENSLSIDSIKEKLEKTQIFFFVGDNDTLIGTKNVEALHRFLEKSSLLKISPSIGRHGHGTSNENFTKGALWIIQK